MSELTYISENLEVVRGEIAAAEQDAAREGKTKMIVAVKYGEAEELSALLSLGATAVGENRVQQLLEHWPLFEKSGAEVHFIGSLQTNKVKYIIDKVAMIHSVDSLRLAAEIDKRAAARGTVMDVLVEINGAREEAKSGVMPEDVEALCKEVQQLSHLRLRGFMTMGPRFDSKEEYVAYFNSVRAVGDAVWCALGRVGKPLYSMGMSESFGAAIAAGSDMIRIGRRLFQK